MKKNIKVKNDKKVNTSNKKPNHIKENNVKVKKEKKTKKKFKLNKKTIKNIFKIGLIVCGVAMIVIFVVVAVFLFSIVKNAPDFDPNNLYQQESSIIYDSEGKIITKLGVEKRENITYEEMAEVLVDAIIATEDSRFFQHNGFDLPRFLVASFGQALGRDAGGASTLTMQISKKYFSKSSVAEGMAGIRRKFTDIYMSIFKIEKNYTKKEILEFYVNSNLLGNGAYGVEQACLTYFGKSAKDVNLAEAAMIAGLFQSPNGYNPYLYPEDAEDRRKTVLYLMERHGYITSEERKIAEKLTIDKLLVKNTENNNTDEYQQFVDMVASDVEDYFKRTTGEALSPYDTPMEIWTTMDRNKQEHIYSVMTGTKSPVTGLTYTWQNDVVQAGISVIDVKTGAIVAVGGRRPKDDDPLRPKNFATSIKRHIGSTAKPLYDYGPGIEFNNWSTYYPFTDEPHAYSDGKKIVNWNHTYNGFLTLRQSVMGSWNIPALKAFQENNKENVIKFVKGLGLSPELEDGVLHEAHALGGYNGESPLTLSAAYAAFANGGYYIEPYSYTKIVMRDTGEVIENKPKKTRAMSEETAYMISDVLVSTGQQALGRYTNINGVKFGAKTGTSNYDEAQFREYHYPSNAVNDIWVAGITPNYSVAVWYGYEYNSSEYYNVISSGQNSRIFQAAAQGVFTDKNAKWVQPKGVVTVEVEKETKPAKLPSEFTPENMRVKELFKSGTEPKEVSNRYNTLDNVTNVKYTIENGVINLSWQPISTPDAIDVDYLTQYFNSIYGDKDSATKYLNQRIAYNNDNIGSIVYKIYYKNKTGDLSLIGTTSNNDYKVNIDYDNEYTYVIKTSYTIFTDNISSGTEITVKNDNNINISLNGDTAVSVNVGEQYVDEAVSIIENGEDVTDDKYITMTIVRKSDQKEVSKIDTSKADVYTITYKVKYKTVEKTIIRTVAILNTANNSGGGL